MSQRTHAGALCRAGHLTHRTLAEARRCDVEAAERKAILLHQRLRQKRRWLGWVEYGSLLLVYATTKINLQLHRLVRWAAEESA